MAVHHVGELVVAVHQAGDEVERPVRAQPFGGHIQAVDFPALDPFEEADPPVDLAFVEAVGPAEIVQPLGLPVHLRQQRDAFGELVGQLAACGEIGVERLGPRPWSRSIGDQPSTKPIR